MLNFPHRFYLQLTEVLDVLIEPFQKTFDTPPNLTPKMRLPVFIPGVNLTLRAAVESTSVSGSLAGFYCCTDKD